MQSLKKNRQWIAAMTSFALIVLAIVGLILTRDSTAPGERTRTRRPPLVDEKPMQTARSMAALASTRDEQRYALQALGLADHAVDLAFADAMREATLHPAAQVAENREFFARVSRAEAQVQSDQEIIDELKKQAGNAKGSAEALQQQLDLLQAQMELDRDELEDAKGDLLKSGADPLSRIQRQFARYQAAQKQAEAARAQMSASENETDSPARNLIAQFNTWRMQRVKASQLQQARDETLQRREQLQQKHDAAEQAKTDEPKRVPHNLLRRAVPTGRSLPRCAAFLTGRKFFPISTSASRTIRIWPMFTATGWAW
jgi:hypothetical protein